jgi:hypothetical protein
MAINPTRTPFTNMSYTPDIPSSALAPQEYNSGYNINTDTRGIKSVEGEEYILTSIPGNQVYLTAGFRPQSNTSQYQFVSATLGGEWYATRGNVTVGANIVSYSNIATPTASTYVKGYTVSSTITDSWNGELLFVNDGQNPPMYLPPNATEFRLYDTAYNDQTNAPGNVYIWNYDVATATANVGNITTGNTVQAFSSLTCGFMRLYAAPNVGSILVAGNFTGTLANITTLGTTGQTINYPTQLRWSQNFGLNSGPITWAPTALNIANQLEVPVRGVLIDGFAHQGNFYICSYWDTCALSPIAYQSTSVPVFGIKIINIGRGLLNENCWTNADDVVYGLDARDIWVFNGGSFKSLGNQRVKDWFYSQLDGRYLAATYMVNNTAKNQIEIYYPSTAAIPGSAASTGYCNRMLSYRYDLDIWNAPRAVPNAIHGVESPNWTANVADLATRTVVFARGGETNSRLIEKDTGVYFISGTSSTNPIPAMFERNNINFGEPYSNRIQVHRTLPEINGTGNANITVGGSQSVASTPVYKNTVQMAIVTDNPWNQVNQNDLRTVSVKVESDTTTPTGYWDLTAMNWQITVVEDSR